MGTCFCTGACMNGGGCRAAGIPPKVDNQPTGWKCPSCGAGVSPWQSSCPNCPGVSTVGKITTPLPPQNTWASGNGCNHSFAFHMVIPPGGANITCPICGAQRFVQGNATYC